MFRLQLGMAVVVALLGALPATSQAPGASKELLKEAKGREIYAELRLREAAAVASQAEEQRAWAKGIKPESLVNNPFAKLASGVLAAKTKGSKLKAYSAATLFAELERRASEKGIFGSDDRQDLYRIEAERDRAAGDGVTTTYYDRVLGNAAAVCCLVSAGRLSETPAGTLRLATIPFSESQHDTLKLCTTERFYTQPCGAFCTGFLVAPDVIVTAGHCVNDSDIANARFVFGYRMTDANLSVTHFAKDNVYHGKEIIGRAHNPTNGEDWAVVRLDRAVPNITPLKFRAQGKIADATAIYVIGYPSGLPCKVSDNAKVSQPNSDAFVFNGNLDTFGGNSGSPVFNQATHEVEGILVRGGKDFVFPTDPLSGCIRSFVLTDTEGNESCTRATVWASKIPAP